MEYKIIPEFLHIKVFFLHNCGKNKEKIKTMSFRKNKICSCSCADHHFTIQTGSFFFLLLSMGILCMQEITLRANALTHDGSWECCRLCRVPELSPEFGANNE